MKLRAFDPDADFDRIRGWISDERSHALWCANRFQYPLEKSDFLSVLSEMAQRTGDLPFVAAADDNTAVGFFCYALNREAREGKLKFVIVEPACRGKGTAQAMLRLAVAHAFEDADARRISLIVFSENRRAEKCYEKAGFSGESTVEPPFAFRGESWSRCSMAVERPAGESGTAFQHRKDAGGRMRPEDMELHMKIVLKQLTHDNYPDALAIRREDVPEAWVDGAASLMEVTDYGAAHQLMGHTYLAYLDEKPVGLIMIGEALAWETDPDEMKGQPFYRVMGFVVDQAYRNRGIGGWILERAIAQVYDEFGERSIALGVHRENARAGRFYERHGFRRTGVYEGNDEYYLRLIGRS